MPRITRSDADREHAEWEQQEREKEVDELRRRLKRERRKARIDSEFLQDGEDK